MMRAILALLCLVVLMLGAALWQGWDFRREYRIGVPRFAGQVLTSEHVSTERYMHEPLDAWVERHREAERRASE